MLRKQTLLIGLTLLLLVAHPTANAAGIFWVVDDATTLDRGQCHLESWVTRPRNADTSLVVAPACTTTTGLELSLTGAFNLSDGFRDQGLGFGIKSVLHLHGRWALASSFRVYGDLDDGVDAWHLNFPLTIWPTPNSAVHLNVGHLHDGSGTTTWGIGGSHVLGGGLSVIAEYYRAERVTREYQAGLRWTRGALTIDLGRNIVDRGFKERRWMLGVSYQF